MAESAKITKMREQHAALAEKARNGDKQAFSDKAKVMNEIRQAEREENRVGKKSLQEEYVRKFARAAPDGQGAPPVEITQRDGSVFRGTLAEYHAKRLGVRA